MQAKHPPKICPKGHENPAGARFCYACSHKFKPDSPPQTTVKWTLLAAGALMVLLAIAGASYFLWPASSLEGVPVTKTPPPGPPSTTGRTSPPETVTTAGPVTVPPDASIEPVFTNSLGMEFRLVTPKTFDMGSMPVEVARSADETLHKVTLTKPFYLMTTEVTQAQWKKVMSNNPSHFKGDNLPVENMTFKQVQEFIAKLNRTVKPNRYRLPTEAEWECACRAGTRSPFSTGNYITPSDASYDYQYSYGGAPTLDSPVSTKPVRSFPKNPWGFYNMHGNVSEWVIDWYEPDYYKSSPPEDPPGPAGGVTRVVRGGSWYSDPSNLRCAARKQAFLEQGSDQIGLRLVLDPPGL